MTATLGKNWAAAAPISGSHLRAPMTNAMGTGPSSPALARGGTAACDVVLGRPANGGPRECRIPGA